MLPVVQTSVHVPPQSTNGLGTAGFIVSLLGLLTCGVLAPIGLLFSLVGLVKAPRGFAIAGSILRALGSLWFLIAGFALITGCLGLGAATGAAMKVSDHYARHGALPDADEGQRLVDPQGVGKFRYVPLDAERFEIRTPRDDGRLGREPPGMLGVLGGIYRAALDGEFRFQIAFRGNVSDIQVPELFRQRAEEVGAADKDPNSPTGMIARILTDGMLPLPAGQTAAGAQWTAVRRWPMGEVDVLRNDLRFRWLADEDNYLGTPAVRIEITADTALELGAEPPEMTLVAQKTEGYGLFDPSAGRLLSSRFEQTLELTGQGESAGVSQYVDFEIRLDAVPSGVEGGGYDSPTPDANTTDDRTNRADEEP